MSIIAIGGIPPKTNLKEVVKAIASPIHGVFEALNFGPTINRLKVCYIRLSEKLNPYDTVEQINSSHTVKRGSQLYAFIPEHVPDLQLAVKPKKLPEKLRRTLKVAPAYSRPQLIQYSHEEIMKEMQSKYTGLYSLSAKTKHALLNEIGQVVYDRIVSILTVSSRIDSCFLLTQVYRKKYPHFGDSKFILSTMHKIKDSQNKPYPQIQENDLYKLDVNSLNFQDMSTKKVEAIMNKYTDKINDKILSYIEKFKEETESENDSAEEAEARKKIREQLINMGPCIPIMTREVIRKCYDPPKQILSKVKIYGEPFLPNKTSLAPFVSRYRGSVVIRSERVYNMVTVRVPRERLAAVLAADGTSIGGAKLVIRLANTICIQQDMSMFERQQPDQDHSGGAASADMEHDWSEQW